MIVGARYDLQTLVGAGGMGTVYKAWDKLTARHVAIKRIDTRQATQHLSDETERFTEFHVKLAREFNILASLHHPNIIKVLDYGFEEEHKPYYVMEYLEESQTILEASENMSLHGRMGLLIQLVQAVVYLHRRGVIHRDLKPDNILVLDGVVRVLDFGIAVMDGVISQEQDQIAGTMAYMAPEVVVGGRASVQSDLYSVGIIAYEMFARESPFDFSVVHNLIMDVLNKPVPTNKLDVPDGIATLIGQLVGKDPNGRPSDAQDVLAKFAKLTQHPASFETAEIRDSYIHRANFVGRQADLAKLKDALGEARAGHGGLWLIGGESGSGISRMMDELRIWSLIGGDHVWNGQAVRERTTPFQTWFDPLCYLTLAYSDTMTPNDTGVLKNILPSIDQFVGHPVETVRLSGEAFVKAVSNIVSEKLMMAERCTLILLEDLHWAVSSIELLKKLAPMLAHMKVLVVCSYRSDERPDLPDMLPEAKVMNLSRFSTVEIEQLTVSILGEAEPVEGLTHLLHQETEGNPFFVTEVIRQLADRAGELHNISAAALPERLSSENIREILSKRFANVPPEVKAFLDMAAVAGRELNIPLLQRAANTDRDAVNYWLMVGANATVLEVKGENWRFAHGKIREMLLDAIPDYAKREFHKLLAETIEKTYGQEDDACILTLAHHWQGAGDVEKQQQYVLQAAKLSMQYSDFEAAVKWYNAALEIMGDIDVQQRSEVHVILSEAYSLLGDLQHAANHTQEALDLYRRQSNVHGVAETCNRLGIILFRQADHESALAYLTQCLKLFREIGDATGEERTLNQLGGIYIELGDEQTALKYYEEAMQFQQRR